MCCRTRARKVTALYPRLKKCSWYHLMARTTLKELSRETVGKGPSANKLGKANWVPMWPQKGYKKGNNTQGKGKGKDKGKRGIGG